jgi:hypothetical protein
MRRGYVRALAASGASILAACSLVADLDGLSGESRPLDAAPANEGDPKPVVDGSCSTCAACGKDCLGGACIDGVCRPLVLAENQAGPTAIAIFDDWVYWANTGDPNASVTGSIGRVRKDGSSSRLYTQSVGYPIALAVDTANVYVGRGFGEGPILRIDPASGFASDLSSETVRAQRRGIVARDGAIFLVNHYSGAVERIATAASVVSSTVLARDPSLAPNTATIELAVDPGGIWFASQGNAAAAIWRIPLAGCPDGGVCGIPITSGGHVFAIDGASLFHENGGHALRRVDRLTGDGGIDLLKDLPDLVERVVVDGDWLYVVLVTDTGPRASRILRLRKDGTEVSVVTSVASKITAVAVDAAAIYYALLGIEDRPDFATKGGSILKLAK